MSDSSNIPRRIVLGITGASGAPYARRTLQLLLQAGIETHLVFSPLGQRLLHDELGMEGVDLVALSGGLCDEKGVMTNGQEGGVINQNFRDVGASIASGSFRHDGMIIAPCSSNTLSAVANGSQQNLIHRAAHVCLKERRRLVLLHREMPLSLVDIRNMEQATLAGAIGAGPSGRAARPAGALERRLNIRHQHKMHRKSKKGIMHASSPFCSFCDFCG